MALELSNTMLDQRLFIVFPFALFAFALTGCPRFAYVEAYNNTKTELMIESPSLKKGVKLKPDHAVRFEFGAYYFKVKSKHGTLTYPRNIPFSGEYGPYYDGTLRVQINTDDVIYALKTGEIPPVSDFPEQPYGYPLEGFEEGNLMLALCLDEIQKKEEEVLRRIANREPYTSESSNTAIISCLNRLQAKRETESQRRHRE